MNKTQDTHVYAVVRIAIQGTNFDEPEMVAKDVADAVSKDPKQWMQPLLGDIDIDHAGYFKIGEVEFSNEVNWTTVIERNRENGDVIREHHFDVTGEPMIGRPGFVTAREARLDAEVEQLRNQLAALTGGQKAQPASKAPIDGEVMHKTITPPNLAMIVGDLLTRPEDMGELGEAHTYQSFVRAVAQAVCDHCGGEISRLPTAEISWNIGIKGNDSLPEGSEGIWQHADVNW